MPSTEADTKTLAARLAHYVQAPPSDFLTECITEATHMVTAYCGQAATHVPNPVLARATLEVAANLYHRRTALSGVTGFEDTDITPTTEPVARNPMTAAYPILRPYMWPGVC